MDFGSDIVIRVSVQASLEKSGLASTSPKLRDSRRIAVAFFCLTE
jgi:hypothetical protein